MRSYLRERVTAALRQLGITPPAPVSFEVPRQAGHGDLTTNIALLTAKAAGRKPRDLAADILAGAALDQSLVSKTEVAGPGFINFTFADTYYLRQLDELLRAGERYGRSGPGAGRKAQVEFVSANPTGPLTVGHGRGAVFGDTIARKSVV